MKCMKIYEKYRRGGCLIENFLWIKIIYSSCLIQSNIPSSAPRPSFNLKKSRQRLGKGGGGNSFKISKIFFLNFEKIKNKFLCVQIGEWCQNFSVQSLFVQMTLKILRNWSFDLKKFQKYIDHNSPKGRLTS